MPDRSQLPPAEFRGGMRDAWFGVGVTFPFGHLKFDESDLLMWRNGARLDAKRAKVRTIELWTTLTFPAGTRVRVIWNDGTRAPEIFFALRGEEVRDAFALRGWPVEQRRWGRSSQ